LKPRTIRKSKYDFHERFERVRDGEPAGLKVALYPAVKFDAMVRIVRDVPLEEGKHLLRWSAAALGQTTSRSIGKDSAFPGQVVM
jgi:hypothetical protein